MLSAAVMRRGERLWYAWFFLSGRFRKPSLEAGHSHTISLMPVCRLLMNTPCVFKPTVRVPVSVTVSLLSMRWRLWGSWLLVTCTLLAFMHHKLVFLHDKIMQFSVCVYDECSPLLIAAALFFLQKHVFLESQCEYTPAMDYSRTDANLCFPAELLP